MFIERCRHRHVFIKRENVIRPKSRFRYHDRKIAQGLVENYVMYEYRGLRFKAMVGSDGEFRLSLYYRVNRFKIHSDETIPMMGCNLYIVPLDDDIGRYSNGS